MIPKLVIYIARDVMGLALVAAGVVCKGPESPLWFIAGILCFGLAEYGWRP